MIVLYMPQYVSYSPNKFQASYISTTKCQLLSMNVSYCQQISGVLPRMLGTYPIYEVYMKLSGSEMSYT